MNRLHGTIQKLLAASLVLAISPFAACWLSTHSIAETSQVVGERVVLELRETFWPGKLVRWAQTAAELPGQLSSLVRPQPELDRLSGLQLFNRQLSWQIRQYHDLYFEQAAIDEYTVIRYEIDANGRVYNARVLVEHTTAPLDVAELAVETVRHLEGEVPQLPAGVGSVEVTELFWAGNVSGDPDPLVRQLSFLPDGRLVQPKDAPGEQLLMWKPAAAPESAWSPCPFSR